MKNINLNNTSDRHSLKHFNLERLNKYLKNDEYAIKQILLTVISELKLSINKLDNCIHTKNMNEIGIISHNLYGTCATIGLEELSRIARLIEQESNFNEVVLTNLIKKIKSEIILVTDLMNNYIYKHSF
jgi:HPt (histidine-containing phosphotransfer) domain-containing protein